MGETPDDKGMKLTKPGQLRSFTAYKGVKRTKRGEQSGDSGQRDQCALRSLSPVSGRPWDAALMVKITIFQIKLVHTTIFWILSLCVVYALFSGIADRVTPWTLVAVGLLLLESVVLVVSGWTCP